MNLSENIRCIREKLKESQADFAARFGISRGAFAKYETGMNEPPLSLLVTLERLTGIPMIRLIEEEIGADEIFLLPGDRVEDGEKRVRYEKRPKSEEDLMDMRELVKLVKEMSVIIERQNERIVLLEKKVREMEKPF